MRGKVRGFLPLLALGAAAAAAQTPPLGPEFPVNTYTTGNQSNVAVAADQAGNFLLVWTGGGAQDGSAGGIFGQRYNASGVPQGAEFQVNTYTTGFQYFPSVAMDGSGTFVVVWMSYGQDGSNSGIFGQRFDANGAPQGGEFQVNSYTSGFQDGPPNVAMNASGNFIVAWSSYGQDGSSYGIFGQRFDAGGAPLGSEFQVNTYTTGGQDAPKVASDSAGNFVVVWSSYSGQDGSAEGVFGQRYDASGVPQGGEFQVNTYTSSSQYRPQVAMSPAGNFVVGWASYGQDGSGDGAFARRYDASGTPLGSEFQVNTYTTNLQGSPRIAFDPSGGFVTSWGSYGQDSPGNYGVFAQRYDSSGKRVGGEFQVSGYTRAQNSVAVDGRGQFVIAWLSAGQDGAGYGIFARRGGFPEAGAMKVDERASTGTSDVNGVLEVLERVTVDPAYANRSASPLALTGAASNFTGPAGPTYSLDDVSSSYGTIPAGGSANCFDAAGNCFEVSIDGARPAAHWDATFDEALSEGVTKTWTLHVGESFPDVPRAHIFYKFIENLFHNGVTGGCGAGNYCPGNGVSRAQMAVFLLKASLGSAYVPPPATGTVFNDVHVGDFAAAFIEDLAARGITGGCGNGNYCPTTIVNRQQMAAFLLKTKYGAGYTPPGCASLFQDVVCPSLFADWIEELYNEQVTGGCGTSPLVYCPTNPVTRGQMAVFLVKTFGLLLYGP